MIDCLLPKFKFFTTTTTTTAAMWINGLVSGASQHNPEDATPSPNRMQAKGHRRRATPTQAQEVEMETHDTTAVIGEL